jgi:adenylate kinase family enzyme
VPLLGPDDALPRRPARVLVAGASGAGKTTLAGRVSAVLGVPHVELDGLYHGPGWVPRPEFEQDVHRFTADPAWVTEWQYGTVRPHLLGRADLLVWLDLPRWVVQRQLVRRTVVRRVRRELLWNGNVEPPFRTLITDPDHVVRWSWRTHRSNADRVRGVLRERPDLPVVRLRTRREADRWVRGL